MKKSLLLFAIQIVFTSGLLAQHPRYLIEFTDKDSLHNPYSLEQPEEFLSKQALERRSRQNIQLNKEDLPVSPFYTDSLKRLNLTIQNRSKWLNSVVAEVNYEFIDSLEDIEFIRDVTFLAPSKEKSKTTKQKGSQAIETTMYAEDETRELDSALYGYAKDQMMMLNGHYLHEKGYQGEGMTIAVIDAGFKMADSMPVFDELWNNGQILGQRDFETSGHNLYKQGNSSHGSYVLSIIGSRAQGLYYGTAPMAEFWLLRSEVSSSEYLVEEYNWVAAAEFADSAGVDVINTSLGYTTFDNHSQNHTYQDLDGKTTVISRAATTAASKGMLVVVSAGNKGNNPWRYISAPADAEDILSVGAVDRYGDYASFSSVGPSADQRVKPEVAAQGEAAFIATPDGSIAAGNGTSFAAPVVAGLSACLWQKHPNKTYKELINLILNSSSQFNSPDSLIGYGLPDYLIAAGFNRAEQITVYPNPFQDSFFVKLPEVSETSDTFYMTIYDIVGRKLFEKAYDRSREAEPIEVSPPKSMEAGVYFLRVRYNSEFSLKLKIIKQ